jgi:glutathione S-transferase
MTRSFPAPAALYTIAMSHYSEKIRWLLDHEGLACREVALTPAFHMLTTVPRGRRGSTVPVLQVGDEYVQDSTRIIEWLERHCAPLATLPETRRADIMAVEERFDAIGKDVARYLYWAGFGHTELILAMWTRFASPAQTRALRIGYPVIKAAFKLKLNINAKSAQRAEERIGATLDWLEQQLADGRSYLVGGRLSVADITAAALLAPIACPPQHPIYGEAVFRENMGGSTPALRAWRQRPALEWVRKIYAEQRGPVWATLPRCA